METPFLPTLNALLNLTSTVLLVSGYVMVRRRRLHAHKRCMIGALVSSALFLTSYITYHVQTGSTAFEGDGIVRVVYFVILIPHVILAAAIVPLVIYLATQALKGNFGKHKRVARWTLPLWLYVSVTGVVIYWMLYHYPAG